MVERIATEVPGVDHLDGAVAPGNVHEGVGVGATREAFGVGTDTNQAGRVGCPEDLGRDLRDYEHRELRARRPWTRLRDGQVGERPAHAPFVQAQLQARDVDPLGERSGSLDDIRGSASALRSLLTISQLSSPAPRRSPCSA
jgi:hypothetical protein